MSPLDAFIQLHKSKRPVSMSLPAFCLHLIKEFNND
uniref:Uncharacterized protein n=1 Tax=Myoviridae sp. ctpiG4 TaxID=2826698 RepID=A0A8S5N2V9_9CAUD|nr:MAG TPA: hypothetical protein [Myoviridae sp. ctpiG4]